VTVPASRRHVVVVGGGVVGCATAYQLARAGLTVTLIERDGIAAHASGSNAGNLNPLHATPPALVPFALESFRLHEEIRAELTQLGCAKYVARPVKRIHLGFEEADRTRLDETARLFESNHGFSSAWLDSNDLRRIEPRLSPDARFGLLTEGSLSLDSYDFTHSLADGAVKLGATVLHDAVSGVAACGQQVTGVRTAKGLVACDDMILATGPWVSDTESWLGISLAVEPVKGEILLMRLRQGTPRYDFTWELTTLYRRRENEVWLGITMQKCEFDCRPTAEAKESLLNRAARMMPAIRDARLLDHIAALRPMTPSHQPLAARAEGWQNVYIANGGGSKGVLLSVGIARKIRDLLLCDGRQLSGEHSIN
jgi:glycine/D-amino acid oxidase-like deaminating enzyme